MVVAVISLLATAASPTFVKLMRDRRVNRAAMQLVDYLRTGRAMAIGRGQPIVVAWDTTSHVPTASTGPGGTGSIQLIEPVMTSNAGSCGNGVCDPASETCSNCPQDCGVCMGCGQIAWGTVATQVVNSFDIKNGSYDYTSITFFDDANKTPSYSQICFSPTGRMYLRNGAGGVGIGGFHPVLGVPAFSVINIDTGLSRRVFVPPNGVARIQL
jgi:Tfp pilus assembly protein FimT